MRLSATLINTFNECAMKAHYKITGTELYPNTASLLLGKALHESIELYDDGYDELSAQENLLNQMSSDNSLYFYPRQTPETVLRKFNVCMKNYIDLHSELPTVVCNEYEFSIPFSGYEIVGKIDQIRRDDMLVEIKSSEAKLTPEYLRVDPQISLYAWAYKQVTHRDPVVVYMHLPSKKVTVVDETNEDFLLIVKDIINKYETGSFYRQPNNWKCARCEYKEVCLPNRGYDKPVF